MRRHALDLVVLGGILALGLARLATPFTGDQSLNMLMGQVIAEGGAPYVDLWDLKHPGIFYVFAAGGRLFGFDEVGIHLIELVWMLALAILVRFAAGHLLGDRPVASFAPALAVGMYYAVAGNVHMTQTEGLVGLPLLVCLVAAVLALRAGARRPLAWLAVSGVAAGVVMVFKAPYVVLPGVFWLLALVEWRRLRRAGRTSPSLLASAAVLVGGLLVPVVATVVHLAARTELDVVWWTFVVYPREAAGHAVIDPQRLIDASVWFARAFAVAIGLAAVGVVDRLRRGWDLMSAGLTAWLIVGPVLIWMQVISWWGYHYLLLLPPLGVLGAQGAATLWRAVVPPASPRVRVPATLALLAVLVLAVPALASAGRVFAESQTPWALAADRAGVREHLADRSTSYARALALTELLRQPGSEPGPIYVFDNPLLYVVSGRRPAVPVLTPWFTPTPDLWHRLLLDLEEAAPAYILVSEAALDIVVGYDPSLADDVARLRPRLEQRYRELRREDDATWYVRNDVVLLDLMEGTP